MAKKQDNFLDYIPVTSKKNSFDIGENGIVTIHMVHTGFYAAIAQKFFSRPRVSHIDLDELGSFIYKNIDGTRSVGEIAELIHSEFGEKAEPLYDRLVQFMKILRNNGFITFEKKRG